MKKRTSLSLLAIAAIGALALSGCSSSNSNTGAKGDELTGLTGTIGAKEFAEQYILANLTSQLLNAHGANTDTNTQVAGSSNVRTALESGDFLGYWEYTGTSWITYNKNTVPVKGAEAQFTATKEADAKSGIAWLDPAPLNNTYAFAIRSDKAKELGVSSLSDVAKLPIAEQTFCIDSEFSTRDDGWPGLKKTYGMDVPESNVALLQLGLTYAAAQKGDDCNFGEVFQTDGRIKALDLTVMKDDKSFFPVYQGAFTLQQTTLDEYPGIADVMALLSPKLTTEVMQILNAKADVDGEDPKAIADDWLTEEGLI
ncbi:glycine betaine ABC transporter substrate-binding protein [Cryobacterium psychrophilum]|uniref:Glycine betaine ABC transporter substrate-binding protein n=1 Tax=Cryobacterium psychrophilum TaxID=41988 RepID=A0A4Y8KN83_9MICO|nr:glycine betaine ABC transporter substrate-binding protein [Cryobacterium psychrophilum]TDW26926.1 osmoprotectant transport system substrate-binding protein [Cryobacterium psychrophilum]TFD75331.1 glycine betaine ABC transporter substrate-binding protein [Cryobacterium psychrophilum]